MGRIRGWTRRLQLLWLSRGKWTEQEPNGEEEVKPVSIDPTNQRMRIGDDTVHYMINNRQLTIEDIEQENGENDTVVLTKQ